MSNKTKTKVKSNNIVFYPQGFTNVSIYYLGVQSRPRYIKVSTMRRIPRHEGRVRNKILHLVICMGRCRHVRSQLWSAQWQFQVVFLLKWTQHCRGMERREDYFRPVDKPKILVLQNYCTKSFKGGEGNITDLLMLVYVLEILMLVLFDVVIHQ